MAARGFTLVEAVTAIVVLSLAMPAMLAALAQAQRERAAPVLASRARWLAVEKLEEVIADRHSPSRGWGHLVAANYPEEAEVAGFEGFSRSVGFAEYGAPDLSTPGEGYVVATVVVGWTGPMGGVESMPIATVLTEFTP